MAEIRVKYEDGSFAHLAPDTPARLKTATAEGPMAELGTFATGSMVQVYRARGWQQTVEIIGEPKTFAIKVLMRETATEGVEDAIFKVRRSLTGYCAGLISCEVTE